MDIQTSDWEEITLLGEEIVTSQKQKLLSLGRRIVSTLTPEDILQPNDFPELENHPEFRYEEGILAGLLTMQMALQALAKQESPLEPLPEKKVRY